MPAGHWAEALGLALRSICEILDCDNAIFVGWRRAALHLQEDSVDPSDEACGWKPCLLVDAFGNRMEQERLKREWENSMEQYGPDEVTLGVLNGTDSLRGAVSCDPAAPCSWLCCGIQSPAREIARISVVHKLDSLSEGVICAERFNRESFSTSQREVLMLLAEATADLHRRTMNGYGVFQEQQSLSPRERDVLQALLTTASEKQIAGHLGLTVRTTHQYVTSVYRKMRAHSRAELMARFFNA